MSTAPIRIRKGLDIPMAGAPAAEVSDLAMSGTVAVLPAEFAGVKRVFIPLHSVVRIDEVEKEGASRISTPESASSSPRVLPIPMPIPGLKNEPR